jgi:uncharacterized membrane protein
VKARLSKLWSELRSSYWFLPAVMTLAAMATAFLTIYVDSVANGEWLSKLWVLSGSTPDGARTVLATIASSMMGVAGVSFSITIAAVVYASASHGPRLLSNFMADRGNQVTLGTFISTFVFCTIVLRTVTGVAEEGGPFVPRISLGIALLLSLASIGVLIFFIHHVPDTIHISNLTSRIGHELLEDVDRCFAVDHRQDPRGLGDRSQPPAPLTQRVSAPVAGYLQAIEIQRLIDLGAKHDCIFQLEHRPGEFLAQGSTLATIHCEGGEGLPEHVPGEVKRLFLVGSKRTPLQDSGLLLSQLAEVAIRALSPGVNDPRSAMDCIDWISAAVQKLERGTYATGIRLDATRTVRLRMPVASFGDFVDASFDFLRPHVARDPSVALYAMGKLRALIDGSAREAHRVRLRAELELLMERACCEACDPRERRRLRAFAQCS